VDSTVGALTQTAVVVPPGVQLLDRMVLIKANETPGKVAKKPAELLDSGTEEHTPVASACIIGVATCTMTILLLFPHTVLFTPISNDE
jgi:hypothetical protein